MFEFQDECRSATITPQKIVFPSVKLSVSQHVTVPVFKDSLDDAGTYGVGICGEKRMILDSDSPKFITVKLSGETSQRSL